MRLIVGLGNPGPRYRATRHNIGVMALERAAARWRLAWDIGRAVVSDAPAFRSVSPPGTTVVLAGPVGWMNASGPPVLHLLRQHSLSPADLIVVHDDLDLAFGRLRVRSRGGAGGHNGVASVMEALGTTEFSRVKLGIGRPAPDIDPADYVLSPFEPSEQEALDAALELAVDALEMTVTDGTAAAMNRFNAPPRPAE